MAATSSIKGNIIGAVSKREARFFVVRAAAAVGEGKTCLAVLGRFRQNIGRELLLSPILFDPFPVRENTGLSSTLSSHLPQTSRERDLHTYGLFFNRALPFAPRGSVRGTHWERECPPSGKKTLHTSHARERGGSANRLWLGLPPMAARGKHRAFRPPGERTRQTSGERESAPSGKKDPAHEPREREEGAQTVYGSASPR